MAGAGGDSEAASRMGEHQFRRLAGIAPVGLFETDVRGRYTYVNERWCEMTGLAPEEALGDGWIRALHPDDRDRIVSERHKLVDAAEPFRLEYRFRTPAGVTWWVEGTVRAEYDASGAVTRYVGVVADIGGLKRTEQRLTFLAEAGTVLASSLDLEVTLSQVARLATSSLADWCAVDLVDPAGLVRRVATAHADARHEAEVQELARRFWPDPARLHPIWQALRTGRSTLQVGDALVPTIAHDEEHARLLHHLGSGAMLVVPLVARGLTLGAMALVRASAERSFARDDVMLAEELARHCAGAVDNARLYAAEHAARAAAERAADRMAHLQAITAALSMALTRDQIVEVILDQGVAALGAQGGAVALLAEDGVDLELVHTSGLAPGVRERWQRVRVTAHVPLAEAFRTGEAIWVESDQVPDRYPTLVAAQAAEGFGVVAALPMMVGDRPIGVLAFRFPPRRLVDDDDRSFASTLTDECSEAIERARLYEAEQRAHARAEQLAVERAAILGQIADGVLIGDQHGRIVFANVAACDLLGRPAEVLVGTFLGQIARVAHSDEPTPLARAALTGERIDEVELQIRRPDGTTSIAEGSATPVLAEDGGRIGAVLTFRDVTARRELERQKEVFFADASHNLRTPVATIKASVEVVLENEPADLPEPLHRLLANIDREADRMSTLVDDLLDLARLEAGRLRFTPIRCDLRSIAERAARSIEPLPGQRGQRLVLSLPRRAVSAVVDPDWIERALVNLLNNAHKYGHHGGTIALSLTRLAREAVFAVADDGPGIPEEDQRHLFERFYRPKAETDRRSQGSGLGLPIAKAMVERHGGRIWVESRPGRGSTFRIALPTAGRFSDV
jgi:PAS domain S-box-containing protein